MAVILLTEDHNGRSISVRVGDTLDVRLPEIPTTGFRWTAVVESDVLALTEDDFQSGADAGIGGGGLHLWRFAVARGGATNLEFRLARSWESVAPRAVFRVRVEVN